MQTWVDKSFELIKAGGYLDKLAEIYPAPSPESQSLTDFQYFTVEQAFSQSDDCELLAILLKFKRFPFNDPYVSFLRENPTEIPKNPKTVSRICKQLRNIGLSEVVKGLEKPKEFNRQMGQMFGRWLSTKYQFTDSVTTLQTSTEPIIFLHASGDELMRFANQQGCGLQKRPDFAAKAHGRYVVGEAKFIGAEGGNQNRGFGDALYLASRSAVGAVTCAILDGIVWIPDSGQMSRRLSNFSGNAMSALLLDDFLTSL